MAQRGKKIRRPTRNPFGSWWWRSSASALQPSRREASDTE